MKTIETRRDFLRFLSVATASILVSPIKIKAATIPTVVVVGGGFAGSTCAKYLKLWGGSSIDVILIDSNTNYVSPILSNLILNNQKSIANLTFNYNAHTSRYKINMKHSSVNSIDKTNKTISLADGTSLNYDYLVLATGIDFIQIAGQDYTKVPHAWVAGEQTTLLKTQLDSMVDGDEFVMSIPAAPYRCPPGPYERACVVADYLKNVKGLGNAKVTVLDANPNITVEADTFGAKFSEYGVTYIPNAIVNSVDSDAKSVTYNISMIKTAKVLNIIPNQKASSLIFDAELNSGNWASVDPISYESTKQNNIFIIGDSQGTSQPKAGHIGNSEAKVCADAILRKINNIALYPNPKTNSACYSPVSRTEASWLTAVYEYDSINKNMKLVVSGAYPKAGAPSTRNYSDMFGWTTNLFQDTFL